MTRTMASGFRSIPGSRASKAAKSLVSGRRVWAGGNIVKRRPGGRAKTRGARDGHAGARKTGPALDLGSVLRATWSASPCYVAVRRALCFFSQGRVPRWRRTCGASRRRLDFPLRLNSATFNAPDRARAGGGCGPSRGQDDDRACLHQLCYRLQVNKNGGCLLCMRVRPTS